MRVGSILYSFNVIKGFYYRKSGIIEQQVEELVLAGAEHIELTADLFFAFDFSSYEQYFMQEIKRLIPFKENGITFSLHASCIGGVATGSPHWAIRKASVDAILSSYRLVGELEPTTITVHPETLIEIARDLKPQTAVAKKFLLGCALDNERKSFAEICAIIPSSKICIENFHFGDIEDYLPLILEFGLSVCYDRGHDYVQNPGPESSKKFFIKWGTRIRHIHFHGVCNSKSSLPYSISQLEDHQPIVAPNVLMDIGAECATFRQSLYDGAVVLEEYNNPDIKKSVAYLRKIFNNMRK